MRGEQSYDLRGVGEHRPSRTVRASYRRDPAVDDLEAGGRQFWDRPRWMTASRLLATCPASMPPARHGRGQRHRQAPPGHDPDPGMRVGEPRSEATRKSQASASAHIGPGVEPGQCLPQPAQQPRRDRVAPLRAVQCHHRHQIGATASSPPILAGARAGAPSFMIVDTSQQICRKSSTITASENRLTLMGAGLSTVLDQHAGIDRSQYLTIRRRSPEVGEPRRVPRRRAAPLGQAGPGAWRAAGSQIRKVVLPGRLASESLPR